MTVLSDRTDFSTSATLGARTASDLASPVSPSLRPGVPTTVGCSDGGGDEETAAMDGVAGAAADRFRDDAIGNAT